MMMTWLPSYGSSAIMAKTPATTTIASGANFRMDGIQGAVLSVKLKHLGQWNLRRQANAKLYDELLADSPVQTPVIDTANKSVYHQYTSSRAPT